jgi:hypothetical protein
MRAAELKAHYLQLRSQLLALEGAGSLRKSCVVRLIHELDQVDRSFAELRLRERTAPTLQDVVLLPHPKYGAARRPSPLAA